MQCTGEEEEEDREKTTSDSKYCQYNVMMMMCGDITPCLCECVLMAAGAAHSRQLQCVSSLHKAGRGEGGGAQPAKTY